MALCGPHGPALPEGVRYRRLLRTLEVGFLCGGFMEFCEAGFPIDLEPTVAVLYQRVQGKWYAITESGEIFEVECV